MFYPSRPALASEVLINSLSEAKTLLKCHKNFKNVRNLRAHLS